MAQRVQINPLEAAYTTLLSRDAMVPASPCASWSTKSVRQ